MFVGELERIGGIAVWGMDSIAAIAPAHRGAIVRDRLAWRP